ncbi:MAG: GNAT family N-acetyltransferase [Cellvibrionaceae bacterium]|nr:GNAT family N-acetyltransferase [Cellvibrionaceae bacterium]
MSQGYRKFEDPDLPALIPLMAQLGYVHTAESLLKNVCCVRQAGGEIFVCEREGSVCACASAILDARLAAGVSGEIVSVVVNERDRGKGIGKGLIACAERWLKKRTSIIRIRANIQRQAAPLFYNALGYSLSKTQGVFEKSVR